VYLFQNEFCAYMAHLLIMFMPGFVLSVL